MVLGPYARQTVQTPAKNLKTFIANRNVAQTLKPSQANLEKM